MRGLTATLAWLMATMMSSQALAMELEPIEVRSRIGEPLLAEVRIRDVPAHAGQLVARLPDPVVFARIGLTRPHGAVSNLRFEVGRPERSTAVIRITTAQPLEVDFLTFLLQVEWSHGSLVREFSIALPTAGMPPVLPTATTVGAPHAAGLLSTPAAQTQPADPAATDAIGSIPGTVARSVDAVAFEAAPDIPPIPAVARSNPEPARSVAAAIPVIPRTGIRRKIDSTRPAMTTTPPPIPISPLAAIPVPSMPRSDETSVMDTAMRSIEVRHGDNLTGIARKAVPAGVALESTLAASLIANPGAFIDGNINRLKEGEILQLPSPDLQASIEPDLARTLIALQTLDWQDGVDDARHQAIASTLAEIESGLAPFPRRITPIAKAPARVKILPVIDAQASTPPDPSMHVQLSPALRNETLASRDAEIRHLQQRIVELERRRGEQRALIAMQDEALAQAQRHLKSGSGMVSLIRSPWSWLFATITACLAILTLRWRTQLRARPDDPTAHCDLHPNVAAPA